MKNIFALALIVVSIAIIFIYVKPGFGAIGDKKTELSSYKDTREKAEKLEEEVRRLKAKKDALDKDDMAKLEKLLPDNVSSINLIIEINNIASAANTSIRNITLAQQDVNQASTKNASLYDSIDLAFDVTSSYSEFQTFLASLERSLRLVDVTSVSFVPAQGEDYVFKVVVRTYWLK